MANWSDLRKFLMVLLAGAMALSGGTSLAGDTPDFSATLLQAQNGDVDAQYTMGRIYGNSQGTAKNSTSAAFWYQRAAMGGHGEAQYQLGLIYETGEGVQQDYTQALEWYGKAAYQGHPAAQSQRGQILNHIDSLKRAADKGEAEAQCTLGDMYAKGNGVRHDDEQAINWYRKAAEQGSAKGQFSLGSMYDEGRGVAQDDQEAVSWYRKSAEQGYADAEYQLGAHFHKGKGVPQDAINAYTWLSLAAAQGHSLAETNRAFAASRLTPDQLEQARLRVIKLQGTIPAKP